MTHLLGARLKLQVASEEINTLDMAIRPLTKVQPDEIRTETNPQTGLTSGFVGTLRICDPVWAVRVGEIAHNIRSALDYSVYELAVLNGKGRNNETQFPIYSTLDGFAGKDGKSGRGKRRIADLRPCDQALIESFQPYQSGQSASEHILLALHELNNRDKHRLIPLVRREVTEVGAIITDTRSAQSIDIPLNLALPRRELQHGAELFSGLHLNMGVEPHIALDVVFGDGVTLLDGKPVIMVLGHILRHVSWILDKIEPCFT